MLSISNISKPKTATCDEAIECKENGDIPSSVSLAATSNFPPGETGFPDELLSNRRDKRQAY